MREGQGGSIQPDPVVPLTCPLCSRPGAERFAVAHSRTYFRCSECALTFLDPAQRADSSTERSRYETHENDPSDAGYRRFLDRLARPLADRLTPGASGLDFGCGPGPTLSVMLEERGFEMAIYDPFFVPDDSVFERSWDFITCTEVAEHLFRPGEELDRLDRVLRPSGWLGLMTQVLDDDGAFETWHYVRDHTHVCFYRPETLEWIARDRGWSLERPARTVALYRKPEPAPETGAE